MILVDATPLQSEHRLRGVGSYVRQLIGALEQAEGERPHYLVSTVGLKHLGPTFPQERTVRTRRGHRPAQVYWLYSELAFRAAFWRLRPAVFFAPDFNGLVRNPFGKTVAVLHDLTPFKLGEVGAPASAQADASAKVHLEAPKEGGQAALPGGRSTANLSAPLSNLRWHAYVRKLAHADAILAVSASAGRDAVTLLGVPEERIRVVHHGLDHTRFRPSTGRGRYADLPPYLIHVGGRNENKNQGRLLEAFAEVSRANPDLHLLFAGPWRESDLAWLAARAQKLGVAGRTRHLGYVSDDDLPSLYGNARAFVFPSLEEGFGMPVLEAMASGAPVITSTCSSLPEVAGDAALLVDPREARALAAAICRVLEPPVRAALRERGARRAAQFSWQRTAAETLGVLRGVG